MPYTINGIGTSYVGKRNVEKRDGRCEACRKETELLSYQTRLWIVVLFIPVIPLKKQQIIDECTRCHRHFALPLDVWEKTHSQAIEESRRQLSEDRNNGEAFIRLHSSLIALNRRNEAGELSRSSIDLFQNSGDVQYYLGNWFYHQGEHDLSERCLERVVQLVPDHQDARYLLGIQALARQDFSRARSFLSFLMTPGPNQDPGTLLLLARAYQKAGQPDDALGVYEVIIHNFPQLAAKDRKFRNAVREVEKSIGRPMSVLPKAQMPMRLKVAAVITALVLLLVFIGHWYLVNNRLVHIVNYIPHPVTVVTTTGASHEFEPYTVSPLRLPLGDNRFKVTTVKGMSETIAFVIDDSLTDLLLNDKAWIINLFGVGVIEWEQTLYAVDPAVSQAYEGVYRYYLGDRVVPINRVDYLFEEFPDTIKLKGGLNSERKSRVSVIDAPDFLVLPYLVEDMNVPAIKVLDVCETKLRLDAENRPMLHTYLGICRSSDKLERCRSFLKPQLEIRPVNVLWHEAYQKVCQFMNESEAVIHEYTMLAEEDPEDKDLLYLRANLETSASSRDIYVTKALAVDSNYTEALLAKARLEMARGNYSRVAEICQAADKADPEDYTFSQLLHDVRWALKEYEVLEKAAEEELKEFPTDEYSLENVLQAKIMLGKAEQARTYHEMYLKSLREQGVTDDSSDSSRLTLSYLLKDYITYDQLLERIEDLDYKKELMWKTLLERGQMESLEMVILPEEMTVGHDCLAVALGWLHHGSSEKAGVWLDRAVTRFEQGTAVDREIARILGATDDLIEQLDDLVLEPQLKRTLYGLLALQQPNLRRTALPRAEMMNFTLSPPHHLIESIVFSRR